VTFSTWLRRGVDEIVVPDETERPQHHRRREQQQREQRDEVEQAPFHAADVTFPTGRRIRDSVGTGQQVVAARDAQALVRAAAPATVAQAAPAEGEGRHGEQRRR
jgi:hypothetical protein